MHYIRRKLEKKIIAALKRGKSILLFGARQTGKTTLLKNLQHDLFISLAVPNIRQRYEINPGIIINEIEALAETINKKPLVIIDEIQKVPEMMDAIQDLIDRKIAIFILTGSSAKKLKTSKRLNLLPGRVVVLQLDPLTILELSDINPQIEDLLFYGSLPGIINIKSKSDKEQDLQSYTTIFLEEEIRMEALTRNVGAFAQFLKLAASESGNIVSFRKLSQEIGIAHTTISSYFQILEDCLVVERIESLPTTKMRRRLIKSPKYIFFDLGLRRILADEGIKPPLQYMGILFEQMIGLELIRMAHLATEITKIYYWRDLSGIEVDWIISRQEKYIPIEVKWTNNPTLEEAKHLNIFLKEFKNVEISYIVCRIPRRIKLTNNIYAIPWQEIDQIFLI